MTIEENVKQIKDRFEFSYRKCSVCDKLKTRAAVQIVEVTPYHKVFICNPCLKAQK